MPTRSVGNEITATAPPERSEIEVSLFGPGFGECVVVHIGGGHWIIVDSCTDEKGRSQPLQYLRRLGVQPERDVILVLSSHWHDDHIRGLADTVEACRSAKFVCSDAISTRNFLTLIRLKSGLPPLKHGSGLDEFQRVVSILRERGQKPGLASESKLLRRDPIKIWALSPSPSASLSFREHLAKFLQADATISQRVCELSENLGSVALWLETPGMGVLLGGDVERGTNDGIGWRRILLVQERPPQKAGLFKVPHHGAKSADDLRVWKEMLTSQPIALISPWELAGSFLPTREDANRVLGYSQAAYITACHPFTKRRPRFSAAVEKVIRSGGIRNMHPVCRTPGHVRVRWKIGDGEERPDVQLFGASCHLSEYNARSG